MARPSKPFFRKQTQAWYCSIRGRQIRLGKERDAAFLKFHELMCGQDDLRSEVTTFYELTQVFLDWSKKHRKSGTYANQLRQLKSFVESVGRRVKVAQLRQHHLTAWLEEKDWSSTTKNDAIATVQRCINWAIEEGLLAQSPIPRPKKPPRKRREVFYTPEQWKLIRSYVLGPLGDLLDFLWLTGCRPQEARKLEARHLQGDLVLFPASEAKGEKHDRVIVLTDAAVAIVRRLVQVHPTGPLFLNSKRRPWTKDAIKCQLTRISRKVGFRVIAYGARHAYATNALINGVDPVSVSHLMGHQSPAMVTQVYSHLSGNLEFLRKQARNASQMIVEATSK